MNPKKLLISMAALSLGGCATVPAKPALPDKLTEKHGVVMVRTMTNASTIDRGSAIFLNQWQGLKVTDSTDKAFELKPIKSGGFSTSQILSAELPAGTYRLQNVYTLFMGQTGVMLNGANESFEVRPSTLTALGTIVIQPTGKSQFTTLRDLDNRGLTDMLTQVAPNLAKSLNPDALLPSSLAKNDGNSTVGKGGMIVTSNAIPTAVVGTMTIGLINKIVESASATEEIAAWRTEKDPAKRLLMAKDSTYAFNMPILLDTGELLAGSNLGQILVRSSEGKWGRLDTGTFSEITSLTVVSPQNLIAGGEEGQIVETTDGGRSWQSLPKLPATAVVVNIHRIAKSTLALVVEHEDAVVYRLSEPGSTSWIESKREKKIQGQPSLSVVSPYSLTSAVVVGDQYQFITANGTAHVLNLQTLQWTAGTPPFKEGTVYHPMRLLRANQNGHLSSLHFRKVMLSRDFGRTWKDESNACTRILDTVMTTNGALYSLCTEGVFVVGTEVHTKSPGQERWQSLGVTPTAASGWYVSPDSKLMVLVGTEGQIYASHDGGKNWKQERR